MYKMGGEKRVKYALFESVSCHTSSFLTSNLTVVSTTAMFPNIILLNLTPQTTRLTNDLTAQDIINNTLGRALDHPFHTICVYAPHISSTTPRVPTTVPRAPWRRQKWV